MQFALRKEEHCRNSIDMLCYTKIWAVSLPVRNHWHALNYASTATNDNNAQSQKLARSFTFCTFEAMESNLVKFLLCTFLPIKTDGNEDSWKRTCVLPLVLRVCMLIKIQGFQHVII